MAKSNSVATEYVKSFHPNKSYRIGKTRDSTNQYKLSWLKKPASKYAAGDVFIRHGCNTTKEFWDRNPFDWPLDMNITIAEVDPLTHDEVLFDRGTHMTEKQATPVTLSDAPTPVAYAGDRVAPQITEVYNAQIADLKERNAKLEERYAAKENELLAYVTKAGKAENLLNDKVRELELKLSQAVQEKEYLEGTLIPKYEAKMRDVAGLGDDMSQLSAITRPFQETIANNLGSWASNALKSFISGTLGNGLGGGGPQKQQAASSSMGTSEDIGADIPGVA